MGAHDVTNRFCANRTSASRARLHDARPCSTTWIHGSSDGPGPNGHAQSVATRNGTLRRPSASAHADDATGLPSASGHGGHADAWHDAAASAGIGAKAYATC